MEMVEPFHLAAYTTWKCCSSSSSSDDDNNDDNDDYSGGGYEGVTDGSWGQKGSERKEEGENKFDFNQTKLWHFYTHLNACFCKMEVFYTYVI